MSNDVEKNINSNQGRRNFIKKGAVGTAVITTISSKSAWAGACSVSGVLSGNLSNQDDIAACPLKGYSHGSWKHPNGNGSGRWAYLSSELTQITPSCNLSTLFGQTPSGILSGAITILCLINPKVKNVDDYGFTVPAGYEHSNMKYLKYAIKAATGVRPSDSDIGLWRQRITAALNARLFEAMLNQTPAFSLSDYTNNDISTEFYYNRNLSWVLSQTSESTLVGQTGTGDDDWYF